MKEKLRTNSETSFYLIAPKYRIFEYRKTEGFLVFLLLLDSFFLCFEICKMSYLLSVLRCIFHVNKKPNFTNICLQNQHCEDFCCYPQLCISDSNEDFIVAA